MARKVKERGNGLGGKRTSREEKGGRGRKRGGGVRIEGNGGGAMSPIENSLKIHWLQMHQNPFSVGAPPRTPLREIARLPQPPRRLGRFPIPIPFLS